MANHNSLGHEGEDLAVNHLLKMGYHILARNYYFDRAEVDIIAKRNDLLIAVEVKTRSTADFGDPQEFVKPKQIRRLVKAVDQFVADNDLDVEVRFDIIAIVKNRERYEIEHLEDAFYHF